ncbi:hypothetical protein ASJ33_05185 [Dehalococcoides mccartyi]|uniref:YopX protein domain-containing protein n=1 Tax=Dehalococcoides mccartyi TaxID=61435 RepID=A0A0V8M0F9_9CHLR|nr:YopX family protein [Dehalococcoides mccartyi]APH12587.1 hypothetical protein ASJ33_05185 [Dehalococcoides mccartyi]AQU03285.1 hypothetical protein B1773_04390 [Dehalococcoides mccartyi]KSV17261.1 hypothetical protein DA01_07785 [Dehalococcoides mccartyi]
MTREIKFRGKRVDTGEWVYGFYRQCTIYKNCNKCIDHINHFIDNKYGVSEFVDESTVGQYTGLKDKNGTEIYEGDIATIARKPEEQIKKIKNLWVIQYSGWKFNAQPNRETLKPLGCTYAQVLEVIGNMHDNPELLKEIK